MDITAAVAATWPPAEIRRHDGWILRRGAGGGNRVSAASAARASAEIGVAEAAMQVWGQRPLFRIGARDGALDAALAGRGYDVHDPTIVLAGDVTALAPPDGGIAEAAILCDGPLACMAEIWSRGGIGPARFAVMARAPAPKVWLLARDGDTPAGSAFATVDGDVAVLHALEILPSARRRGLGTVISRAAAAWAVEAGASTLALAVTERNAPARALYGRLGLRDAGRYHYRIAPETPPARDRERPRRIAWEEPPP